MKKFTFIAFFIVCLQAGVVYGNDQPIVRASISPEEVVVGSEVTLTITVLTPTWFSKAPVYPSMETEGVVTVLPPDSTYSMSEMRDGNSWSGLTREYKLYALGTGKFDLQDKRIGIAYADPQTRKPILTKLSLPALRFSAVTPPGAENLNPFLAGSELELTQEISQEADIYRPGDAIERRITVRLQGMPSLFISPLLSKHEVPGVSIYPGSSHTEDEYDEEKKVVTGVRKEVVTYVFERGGVYKFPPVTMLWWNIETEQVETAKIEPMVFQVEKSFAQQIKDLPRPVVFTVILIALALTLFIIYSRKFILKTIVSSWTRFCHSELNAFLGVIFRVLFRNLRTAYLGILGWQRRFIPDPGHALGSDGRGSFLALEHSIYGPDSTKAPFGLVLRGKLVSELFKFRSDSRAKQRIRGSDVGSLNPY